MKILGITLNSELKVDEHIESLIIKVQPDIIICTQDPQSPWSPKGSNSKSHRGNDNVQNAIIGLLCRYSLVGFDTVKPAIILKIDKLQRKLQRIE